MRCIKSVVKICCAVVLAFSLVGCGVSEDVAMRFAEDVSLMVQKEDTDAMLKTYGNVVSPDVSAKIAGMKVLLDPEVTASLDEFSCLVLPDDKGYDVVYYAYRMKDVGNSSWVVTTVRVEDDKIQNYDIETLFQNQLLLG